MENNVKNDTQAERLRMLTIRLKITTRDLAKMIGMNENTLYKINSGLMPISNRTASKICYFLEQEKGVVVNRQWLLTGEGEMLDEKHSVKPYEMEEESGNVPMAAEEPEEFGTNYREKYYEVVEKYNDLLVKYSSLLESLRQ